VVGLGSARDTMAAIEKYSRLRRGSEFRRGGKADDLNKRDESLRRQGCWFEDNARCRDITVRSGYCTWPRCGVRKDIKGRSISEVGLGEGDDQSRGENR